MQIEYDDFFELSPEIYFPHNNKDKIDKRIFTDQHASSLDKILNSPIKINNPSIQRLIQIAGIRPMSLSNEAVDFISDVVYTKLDSVLKTSLIIKDSRGAKILSYNDVYNAIKLVDNMIISEF